MLTLAAILLAGGSALSTTPPAGDETSLSTAWRTEITDHQRLDLYGSRSQAGSDSASHPRATSRPPVAPHTPAPRDCGPLNRCDDFTVSLLPQATIADVASFAPAPAELVSEPAGLGVVGLPTNFIVTATEHTATGTLFDLPVTVRFSPEGVTIAPGDGSRISSGGGGRSWGELGASQFAPTDTSHTYTERGTYSASAVVHYRAEVDFGRGWRPVPGTLDVATGPHMVRVLEARGTLVERTCDEAPRGPGC